MKCSLFALVLLTACLSTPATPQVGTQMPARSLEDPEGQTFTTGERYRGQILVVDFWASWCVACKQSILPLARLQAAYGDRIAILGVNAGEDLAQATAGARAFGMTYPFALDQNLALSDSVGAGQLPYLIVIDQGGIIRARARELDEPTLAVIDDLLQR
jgi:thiol-disulfide isomerase/thioredoxin